jgi:hypothetical protein
LAEPFAICLPAVSKQLKVLEGAGLVPRGHDAKWRPCRLAPEPLKEGPDWRDVYRRFWEASFDHRGDYLAKLQSSEKPDDRDA